MEQDSVIVALEEQVAHYRRLAKLAELQHVHVQQSQTEELLDVLRRRQEVLEQVARLEQIVAPAKRRWSQYLDELDTDRRSRAETMLAETRRLLEEITSADRDDALVLQQRKLNVGRQLTQARVARQVNRNYAAAYGPRPSRMDIQR